MGIDYVPVNTLLNGRVPKTTFAQLESGLAIRFLKSRKNEEEKKRLTLTLVKVTSTYKIDEKKIGYIIFSPANILNKIFI